MNNGLKALVLGYLLSGTIILPPAALSQEAGIPAVQPMEATDPNIELRATLARLKTADDNATASLALLQELLKLNVCDPATRAKIESLLAASRSALQASATPAQGKTEPASLVIDQAASSSSSPPLAPAPALAIPASTLQADDAVKTLDRAALLERLNAMTVLVLTPKAFGSGIIVGPTTILTNRHVIEASRGEGTVVMNKAEHMGQKGELMAATASSSFNEQDFALVSVGNPMQAVEPQLSFDAEPLDIVVAAGYPGTVISNDQDFMKLLKGGQGDALDLVLSSGISNTMQNSGSSVPVIVHTAEIAPGSSGGPLVNACGQLVGINTFMNQANGGTARFAISAKAINEFLSSHQIPLGVGPKCASGQQP